MTIQKHLKLNISLQPFLSNHMLKSFLQNIVKAIPWQDLPTGLEVLASYFQRGSPLVTDISEAILQLSENGELNTLEQGMFFSNCSSSNVQDQDQSLGPGPFYGLFLITGGIVLSAFLITMFRQLKTHRQVSSCMESTIMAEKSVTPSSG